MLHENIKQILGEMPPELNVRGALIKPAEEKKKQVRKAKNTSPAKKTQDHAPLRAKSSLYHPVAQPATTDGPSEAPTPAGGSESDADYPDTDHENAQSDPSDQYGLYLPNKPTPRNGDPPQNRFRVKPHLKFDDEEIGIRQHHTKRNNRNEGSYVGHDPQPNPPNFHFDTSARGHDASENEPGDLDEAIVQKHKLHPLYGLPIEGTVNPDPTTEERTDWNKDLPVPNPTIFFSTNEEGGLHKVYFTSRSAYHIEAEHEFWRYEYPTEESDTRAKLRKALHLLNQLLDPAAPARPTTPPQQPPARPAKIDPDLLMAIDEAVKEAARVKTPPPPPPVSIATTPRSHGYDPVRDTGYQTPYPNASIRPPPRPVPPPEDRSNFAVLYDAIELKEITAPSQPPVRTAQRTSNWVPPQPPPPPSMRQQFRPPPPPPQPMQYQSSYPSSFASYQPAPYAGLSTHTQPPQQMHAHPSAQLLQTSPVRSTAAQQGAGGLRQLAPAPPQLQPRRPIPPPAPRWSPYPPHPN